MFLANKKILLASKSPRRQQLLKEMGFEFEIRTKDVDEVFPDDLPKKEVAEYLAKLKAKAFLPDLQANEICITADTVVLLNERIYGKAADKAEAMEMLTSLSGKTHEVITGVSIISIESQISFSDCTQVHFRILQKEEISHYIDKFAPFDKAGAYGIQEWIGMVGIDKIEGSYFNVVGLPTEKLFHHLRKLPF